MIELNDVSKVYERGSRALKNVSLRIEDGEFVFIMGRSGAGKSTLVRLLMKETEPSSGTIVVNDISLNEMRRSQIPKFRRTIGVVFQDFRLLRHLNVYENVAFAQRVIGRSGREIREAVPEDLYGAWESEELADIDILAGTNRDETRYWIREMGLEFPILPDVLVYKLSLPFMYENDLKELSPEETAFVESFMKKQTGSLHSS